MLQTVESLVKAKAFFQLMRKARRYFDVEEFRKGCIEERRFDVDLMEFEIVMCRKSDEKPK